MSIVITIIYKLKPSVYCFGFCLVNNYVQIIILIITQSNTVTDGQAIYLLRQCSKIEKKYNILHSALNSSNSNKTTDAISNIWIRIICI